jgi:hypothetical protein
MNFGFNDSTVTCSVTTGYEPEDSEIILKLKKRGTVPVTTLKCVLSFRN